MRKIACRLICHSNTKHIQQIYTGFSVLHKRGLLDVTQNIIKEERFDRTRPVHLRDARRAHLRVILNNGLKLHYDAHDSSEIDHEYLSEVDFYFKRSFSSSCLENFGKHREKIYPLGLYYPVYPSSLDKHALKRSKLSANIKQRARVLARSFNFFDTFQFTPRVHIMESLPDYNSPPRILFVVKARDPYAKADRLEGNIEERGDTNQTRANCIKLLKDEFGHDFYGGFIHTEYAVKNYEALLLPDDTQSSKRNYINLLNSHSICVATTGLHGSIGAKFAEYVALSKAILSETLNYEAPGNLEEGRNYLAFSSPEECVEKAKQLYSNRELRSYLMTNNSKYYQTYLRPDSLVLNTIITAMGSCETVRRYGLTHSSSPVTQYPA